MKIGDYIYTGRIRKSDIMRCRYDEFASDRSRIVFCSSFRRMMQKAQVFSLETNSSVRNRLTHSLEVADIGRTLARNIGNELLKKQIATEQDVYCMEAIVENACLIHDIGNPPFGHFGEEAIKRWFKEEAYLIFNKRENNLPFKTDDPRMFDLYNFDGNPQGFRIVTKLHTEKDQHGLNLTYSTLLASSKYPCSTKEEMEKFNYKKIGIFGSEKKIYERICTETKHPCGKRYFLVYLMELADDICYCLSDIADAFEKKIIESRFFKEEFKKILKERKIDKKEYEKLFPEDPIKNFSQEISIPICRMCIKSAVSYFVDNINDYINGDCTELSKAIPEGEILECLKIFARKYIYTEPEVQRLEIAGNRIVWGLLEHFGSLLKLSLDDFKYFYEKQENLKGKGFDMEWRIYNQLSKRMLQAYKYSFKETSEDEWFLRCKFIVDYISGMTDQTALQFYQNIMAIKL